jgi:hypothetical protein
MRRAPPQRRGGSAPPRQPGEQERQLWYARAPRRRQPHARSPRRRLPWSWRSAGPQRGCCHCGDNGGMWRQSTEEGGGGEGSSRWRHPVEGTVGVAGEERGTGAAEQQGASRAH